MKKLADSSCHLSPPLSLGAWEVRGLAMSGQTSDGDDPTEERALQEQNSSQKGGELCVAQIETCPSWV